MSELSKLEQEAEKLVTRDQFEQFMNKCWLRVCGGPDTVNKGEKEKKSYIICDNLRDSEEELLDINNYNFLLWLKLKNFPKYLVHEIHHQDYRQTD